MNANQFVESIKIVVERGAAHDVIQALEQPPGRRPDSSLLELSAWFKTLSPRDRESLQATLALATRQAAYNILLILDGLSAIEPSGEKGRLHLFYEKDGTRVLINDPQSEQLTFLFKEIDGAQ